MPFVAPWLNPPDYLRAMQSGAGLGLQIRSQQAQEAQQAAAQALQQQSLFQQQQERQAAMAEREREAQMRQQNAIMALQQQARYHADTVDQRERENQRADAAGQRADASLALRGRAVDLSEDRFLNPKSAGDVMPDVVDLNGMKFARNPKTGSLHPLDTKASRDPSMSPTVKMGYLNRLDKIIADAAASDEEKAQAQANKASVLAGIGSALAPAAPKVVPIVTPGGLFSSPKTNYVPAQVTGAVPGAGPKSKVQIAREISAANPTWTKQEVIDAVNNQ